MVELADATVSHLLCIVVTDIRRDLSHVVTTSAKVISVLNDFFMYMYIYHLLKFCYWIGTPKSIVRHVPPTKNLETQMLSGRPTRHRARKNRWSLLRHSLQIPLEQPRNRFRKHCCCCYHHHLRCFRRFQTRSSCRCKTFVQ